MSNEREYEAIRPLADRIYAEAASMTKIHRWIVSDAAKLISWMAYLDGDPHDAEALAAVSGLSQSVQKHCKAFTDRRST